MWGPHFKEEDRAVRRRMAGDFSAPARKIGMGNGPGCIDIGGEYAQEGARVDGEWTLEHGLA